MGSMKEHMMDLQEERFEAWAAEHYPDVTEDTVEWEQIRNYYFWEQEAQEDQFYEEMLLARYEEDLRDRASLENIEVRFESAMSELNALERLLATPHPELIWRMAIVHSVSVMDGFFMYCARALLNHDWPLQRFRDAFYLKSRRIKNTDKQKAAAMEISLFRPVARVVVSGMTFQNPENIQKYFSSVLQFPGVWPLHMLEGLTELRNDLSHRNGYTRTGSKVNVCATDLRNAVSAVRAVVKTAMGSLRLEDSFFSNDRGDDEKLFVASMLGFKASPGAGT